MPGELDPELLPDVVVPRCVASFDAFTILFGDLYPFFRYGVEQIPESKIEHGRGVDQVKDYGAPIEDESLPCLSMSILDENGKVFVKGVRE